MAGSTVGCARNAFPKGYVDRYIEDLQYREDMLKLCRGPDLENFTISPEKAMSLLNGIGVVVTLASLTPGAQATAADDLAIAQAYVTWYLMIACILAGVLLGFVLNQGGRYAWRLIASLAGRYTSYNQSVRRFTRIFEDRIRYLHERIDAISAGMPHVEPDSGTELPCVPCKGKGRDRRNDGDRVVNGSGQVTSLSRGGRSKGKGKGKTLNMSFPLFNQRTPNFVLVNGIAQQFIAFDDGCRVLVPPGVNVLDEGVVRNHIRFDVVTGHVICTA